MNRYPSSAEDLHWQSVRLTYNHYPSVRHRWDFISRKIKTWQKNQKTISVFDYGCGNGGLLLKIRNSLHLASYQLSGCDTSENGLKLALENPKLEPNQLYLTPPDRFYDVITCSEVIEHTPDYDYILDWLATHLSPDGLLILTTQSGKIHASDIYTGHTQHFKLNNLLTELKYRGLKIVYARNWGFPFFTIQKYITDVQFEAIRENYLEGELSFLKKFIFSLAYYVFYLNYLLPWGPQLFIIATRTK